MEAALLLLSAAFMPGRMAADGGEQPPPDSRQLCFHGRKPRPVRLRLYLFDLVDSLHSACSEFFCYRRLQV